MKKNENLIFWLSKAGEEEVFSGPLPDEFEDIIRFIESDLVEVKIYGDDGFGDQEELHGKEYLVQLIKGAVVLLFQIGQPVAINSISLIENELISNGNCID